MEESFEFTVLSEMFPEKGDWAFIKAILADPRDEAPRLIYSDWLEERGRSETAKKVREGWIPFHGYSPTRPQYMLSSGATFLYHITSGQVSSGPFPFLGAS